MWSTRRLNDMDRLSLANYASGADATGYPRPRVTHYLRAQPWSHPGAEVRRRHRLLILDRLCSSV